MKIKIETLKDLVSDTVSTASCKLSSDQGIVGKAGSFVLSAGKSAQQVIDGVLEHEDTKAVIAKAKELSSSTAIEAKKLIGSVADELNSDQGIVGKAGSFVLSAGKSAQQAIDGVLEHEDTKAVIAKAKELSSSTAIEAKKLIGSVADELKEVDMNHKEIADKVETVSMGLSIASGVVAAGAALAAPTGLSAVGVALGITSTPLIVTAAPVIGAVATAAGVVSGSAYFYSKWKMKKEKDNDHATFPDTRMQTIEADNPAIEPQLRPRRGGRVVD